MTETVTKNKTYSLSEAEKIAREITEVISPYCVRFDIAGSVRRKKMRIGDIEVVCLPDYEKDADEIPVNLFEVEKKGKFFEMIRKLGVLQNKADETSRYIKIDTLWNIQLDIFIPQVHDYYRQLAIRTGNWVFSKDVLAMAWRNIGWCGTKDGLRKTEQCFRKAGTKIWTCNHPMPELPPVWTSEQDFFSWLGVAYVEPEKREMQPDTRRNPDGDTE